MTSAQSNESEMAITDINPANGHAIGEVPHSDLSTFDQTMVAAREAQAIWGALSFRQRASHIKKMQHYIVENAEQLSKLISQSNGKTRIDALATEVLPGALACQWYAKHSGKVLGAKRRGLDSLLFLNKRTEVRHLPLGVVGIVSPWNYPFSIPFGEVVMGLMAGNAVILKVAAATPMVGVAIEKIVAAAGLPEGLFQHIVGKGSEVSSAFFAHGIDKLFFTGSVETGKTLMAQAAATLTPLSLELGGNDPMIVLADADLERAANGALWAGFQNAGQSCAGVERVYVERSVYPEFLALMAKKTTALRHGYRDDFDVDIGAVTTKGQLQTIQTHFDDAVAKGATVVAQSQPTGELNGTFFPATVLTDVSDDMLLIQEETFGPLIPVMPFDSIEEVIALANTSELALTSSVWTRNNRNGRQIAAQLHTGVTTVNDHLYSHGLSAMPWGGWKHSGIGRTHGAEGLLEMSHVKAINWDLMPGKRNLWWHPFDLSTYQGLLHAMNLVFARSLPLRLKSALLILAPYWKKFRGT